MTTKNIAFGSRLAIGCVLLALTFIAPRIISGFYESEQSSGRVLYGVIFPSLPFIVLCIFTLARCEGRFVFGIPAIIGATAGAIVSVVLPWVVGWYFSHHYRGGGFNFGVGFLLLFQPVYIPVAMLLGGWLSRALWQCCFERSSCQPSAGGNAATPRASA